MAERTSPLTPKQLEALRVIDDRGRVRSPRTLRSLASRGLTEWGFDAPGAYSQVGPRLSLTAAGRSALEAHKEKP